MLIILNFDKYYIIMYLVYLGINLEFFKINVVKVL